MFGKIKNYNLEDNIIFTGYISDEMLPNYYRGALVLIMPSIYEGFGLPVIEAMACGIPTIASATTSLGEIAGDASLLIDPFDVESIKDALEKIISDQMLQKELKIKGLEHVKKYTWEKTVNKVKVVVDALK